MLPSNNVMSDYVAAQAAACTAIRFTVPVAATGMLRRPCLLLLPGTFGSCILRFGVRVLHLCTWFSFVSDRSIWCTAFARLRSCCRMVHLQALREQDLAAIADAGDPIRYSPGELVALAHPDAAATAFFLVTAGEVMLMPASLQIPPSTTQLDVAKVRPVACATLHHVASVKKDKTGRKCTPQRTLVAAIAHAVRVAASLQTAAKGRWKCLGVRGLCLPWSRRRACCRSHDHVLCCGHVLAMDSSTPDILYPPQQRTARHTSQCSAAAYGITTGCLNVIFNGSVSAAGGSKPPTSSSSAKSS